MIQKIVKLDKNYTKHNPLLTREVLNDMASMIRETYGPTGASTLMITGEKDETVAGISKDGFAVLSRTKYMHPAAIAIKKLILDSMLRVLKTASDGTTTTTLLIADMYSYLSIVMENGSLRGVPPQVIKNIGLQVLNKFKEEINKYKLDERAVSIKDVYGIIKTSTNDDDELYDTLKEAVDELSKGGNLNDINLHAVVDANISKCKYNIKEGYVVPSGAIGLYSTLKTKVTPIIINESLGTSDDIKGFASLLNQLGDIMVSRMQMQEAPTPVVLITYNMGTPQLFEKEIQKFRLRCNQKYGMQIPLPIFLLNYVYDGSVISYDEHRDFEFLLGQSMPYTLGITLSELFPDEADDIPFDKDNMVEKYVAHLYDMNSLPICDAVLAKTSTTFYNVSNVGNTNTKEILVDRLNKERAEETEPTKISIIDARLRKINGRYAEIVVGGENEWDIKRKQDSVDDAMGAIKAAIKSGVCGGMSTLIPKVAVGIEAMKNTGDNKTLYDIVFSEIFDMITTAYYSLFTTLTTNVGIVNIGIIDKIFEKIVTAGTLRESLNLKEYILNISSGYEEDTAIINSKSEEILNSIDAEVKILEASVNAVLTLIGINQITMPDQYDVNTYEQGAL